MDTSASLLQRLHKPNEQEAWARFVKLYAPLLYFWARRLGSQEQDAADLVQDVLIVLIQKLPEFNYDQNKSFRGWLRTVAHNCWHNRLRRAKLPATPNGAGLAEVAGPNMMDAFEETEYRKHLVGRALEVMQLEFEPTTWQACWEFVVGGKPAADVARELGLSVGAVHVAKSRVISRLRRELEGLWD